ncbi:MAG: TonB-dependent receptor plug domain-containing protein [Prevotellaceae bacterium]|jgi:outer membrane cobalamin receptor|nr:TonB-dependent receptor plug domain-containing protein [Prevotellaceae bacterium]
MAKLKFYYCSLFFLIFNSAFSQNNKISSSDNDMRHDKIDSVIIVGKSKVREINESAYNVVSIDTKLLYNTTLSITQTLDRISGIKIRETGGVGSDSQISINGFSGKHIKIFMDGMPMEGFGSSFQINNMPVNLADRIDVYKGVVPIEFCADALGGAINIVTKQLRKTYLDVSYTYGSFNTHKSNISLGHTTKNGFVFQLNAYQNYSDNSYKVRTKLLDLQTSNYSTDEYWFKRFHDNYHNEAVIAKVGVVNKTWADKLLLGITLSQEKDDIQNANLMKIVYGGKERRAKSIIPTLNYEKKNLIVSNLNFSLTANYNIARNNNTDTLARQYNWNGEYRKKGTKGEGQYSLSEYDNKNALISVNLNYRLNEKHYFALNNLFSAFVRKATDAAANSETSNVSTFMQRKNSKNVLGFSYKFEPDKRWNTSAFFKYYDVNVKGPVNVSTTSTEVYEEKEKSFNTTGYGILMTYFLTSSFQIKASFEKAYRLPSERELFGDEVLETGDVSLKPESSRNINVNISYSNAWNNTHSVYFDAGLIYRYTRDYIRRQIEQRYGGAFYTNHGKVINAGIDFEARYFYKNKFSAGGNITYQNIRNMEKYDVGGRELIYYKDCMPNVPYFFGNIDANYNIHNLLGKDNVFSFGYNLSYVHSFFRDWKSEGGDIIIPMQLSHDLNITYTLKNGKYNISLEIKNITDEILYDNYSLQKPGRSFSVKLRYFFFNNNFK